MGITELNSLIGAQSSDALTIARQAVAVESPSTRAVRDQQRLIRTRSDALRDINTRLAALLVQLEELTMEDVVTAKTATTDLPGGRSATMTVRTAGDALDGEFRVWIEQLATHTKVRSSGPIGNHVDPRRPLNEAGLTTIVTSGGFRVNGTPFFYNAARETLAGLLVRINQSRAAVTASYDDASATITLIARYSGDLPIELEEQHGNFLAAARLLAPEVEPGQNARVRVATEEGEETVESPSNSVPDLLPGITLELIQTSNGPISVRVRRDLGRPVRALRGFAAKYNQLMALLHQMMRGGHQAVEPSVQEVHDRLRDVLVNHLSGLREVGVHLDEGDAAAPVRVNERRLAALVAQQPDRVRGALGLERSAGPLAALRDYVSDVVSRGGVGAPAEVGPAVAEPQRERTLLAHFTALQESLAAFVRHRETLASQMGTLTVSQSAGDAPASAHASS